MEGGLQFRLMKNLLLDKNSSVLVALKSIEDNSEISTLIVVDEENHLLGTLTDGDIRRFLIAGGQVTDIVYNACNLQCIAIQEDNEHLLTELNTYKNKGIKVLPIIDQNSKVVDIINLSMYKSRLPVDVVLMAGGKGERLRPLTEKMPKPLVKVGDKCIIDYNIDNLISYGVKHINVTVNYLAEQLEEHFSELRKGVLVRTIREPKFLGTIGSVKFVDTFYNDYVLVMNSDIFTDIDFEDFFLHFREHDAEMSVAAVPYNVSIPLGILDLDGRNIKGLVEKPKYNYYANAGIYLIKREALDEIPEDTFFHATDLIERLIAQGKRVIRYPLKGTWIDIGQHADLAKAQDLVKRIFH